jgi:hypothetical protein
MHPSQLASTRPHPFEGFIPIMAPSSSLERWPLTYCLLHHKTSAIGMSISPIQRWAKVVTAANMRAE